MVYIDFCLMNFQKGPKPGIKLTTASDELCTLYMY